MKLLLRLLLGAALLDRSAAAQPPRPYEVVIVGEPSDRLVQDLKIQLAESHIAARVSAPTVAALPDIAETEHVTAVVRVPPSHDELQVWLASWQAGRPLLDMRLKGPPGGDEEALVLQCIELLRQSQSSAEAAPGQAPAPPPVTARPPSAASPSPPTHESTRLRLELGAAYNLASSRVRWASLDGAAGVSSAHWFALLKGSAPWSSAVVTEPDGSAELVSSSIGLGAGFCWKPSRWQLRAGPLLGARRLRVIGTDSVARAQSEAAWQFEAGADAKLEYRALLPFFLGVRATVVAPQGHVRFFEVERASFGPLVAAVELGVAPEL